MRFGFVVVFVIGACESASPAIDAGVTDTVAIDARPIDSSIDASARAAVIGNCADVTGPGGLTAEVTNTMGYVPTATATLEVGEIATFAYADDGTEHTIVSGAPGAPDGLFASAPFSTHGAFTCIRFDAPGTYPIHCDRHAGGPEQGTITVVP